MVRACVDILQGKSECCLRKQRLRMWCVNLCCHPEPKSTFNRMEREGDRASCLDREHISKGEFSECVPQCSQDSIDLFRSFCLQFVSAVFPGINWWFSCCLLSKPRIENFFLRVYLDERSLGRIDYFSWCCFIHQQSRMQRGN